jgi:hypothetical protein
MRPRRRRRRRPLIAPRKRRPPRKRWPNHLMGAEGAPRMSGLGRSSPPRVLQVLSLQLHIYLLFFMCN